MELLDVSTDCATKEDLCEMKRTMLGYRKQRQLYIVIGLAAIILAISVWAFAMTLRTEAQSGIVNHGSVGGRNGEQSTSGSGHTLDTEALAAAVLAKVSFDTEISRMEDSVVESMITKASEDTVAELYMGEGTSADELLVVTVEDDSKLNAEIESVQKHLTDMQQSFQDYLPKEAKKINDAVILQSGHYIVACVSADKDTARSVIEEQLKM